MLNTNWILCVFCTRKHYDVQRFISTSILLYCKDNLTRCLASNPLPSLNPVWTPFETLVLGGGQICPPLNYGYRSMFSLLSFSQGSFLGCKGSESKSTAIYLRKYIPESFWKNHNFLQNLKKIKNSLFGNQTFCREKCCQN